MLLLYAGSEIGYISTKQYTIDIKYIVSVFSFG